MYTVKLKQSMYCRFWIKKYHWSVQHIPFTKLSKGHCYNEIYLSDWGVVCPIKCSLSCWDQISETLSTWEREGDILPFSQIYKQQPNFVSSFADDESVGNNKIKYTFYSIFFYARTHISVSDSQFSLMTLKVTSPARNKHELLTETNFIE